MTLEQRALLCWANYEDAMVKNNISVPNALLLMKIAFKYGYREGYRDHESESQANSLELY